jgi:hypothetical protein
MSCLILNLGCECQTIFVSLKNGALSYQSSKQGIYQRAGKVNGKTSWISSSSHALWFNPASGDWMIGPVEYLGTDSGFISSTGDQGRSSCPYNVPNDAWMYGSPVVNSWVIAGANDVSIECLTGNHSFWQLRSIILRLNKDEVMNYDTIDCTMLRAHKTKLSSKHLNYF